MSTLRRTAAFVWVGLLITMIGSPQAHAKRKSLYFAFDAGGAFKISDKDTFGGTTSTGAAMTLKIGGPTKSRLVDWEFGLVLSLYNMLGGTDDIRPSWVEYVGRLSVNFYLPSRRGFFQPYTHLGIEMGNACVEARCAPEQWPAPPDARVDAIGFGVAGGFGTEMRVSKRMSLRFEALYRGMFWRGATRLHYHNAFTLTAGFVVAMWK